ncbi:MAG: alanine--glyoxylate aminotransferase family protein [Chloroflexi bacterium]|jgi:aspartate aminotransferase-like enzyme|nr:alanine--glyoxylate aminotransferase family protein [Chloroflexota bacterium]
MSPMFVPGPVDVAPEVLAAQARPMMPHRSKEFETLFQRTAEKAQKLFYTQNRIFQGTASGSGMQEAGVRNFVQDTVLACVNGAFAERWYDVAVANGKQADRLEVEWGKAVTPDLLEDALRKKHYEAVTIVHNETSTGVQNPVQELAAVVQELSPDTLVLVDAVSSLGGVKIEMDAWGIDFLLTSSQKCLALPPGLSLASASDRAMQKAETVKNRGWYFDLLRMEKHRLKDSTPMTPAMPLIYALDVQLDRIFVEGLEERFARHAAMAARVQAWALERGMPLVAAEGYRSNTVTAIHNERGFPVAELNKFLFQRGMRIANGYGGLKEVSFRIAHMGELQLSDIDTLLSAMDEFLA